MSAEANDYFRKDEALERVDGDLELFFELIDIFFEDYDSGIEQISAAIKGADNSALEQKAHSIKSALGNLGAMHAFDISFVLEKKGRENQLDGAAEQLEELKKSVQEFRTQAETLRPA